MNLLSDFFLCAKHKTRMLSFSNHANTFSFISDKIKKYIWDSTEQSMQRHIANNQYKRVLFETHFPRDEDDIRIQPERFDFDFDFDYKPAYFYFYTIPLGFFLLSRYLEKK